MVEAIWERGQAEAEAIAAMLEKNGLVPGSRLLELGAGNARAAIPLARRGYRVTGVEYSRLFVEDGPRRVREAGLDGMVELVHGDVYHLASMFRDKVFDAVYTTWTSIIGYGVSEECDEFILRQVQELVRLGGLLAIANTVSYDSIGPRQGLLGPAAPFPSRVSGEVMVFEGPDSAQWRAS